jgi:ankyrin repeat protein
MVERFAPKTFLELIFTIATPTVDAISETLLGHRYIPKPLGLLLGVGVSRRHLTGDRPWKMFCSAFHAKALDPETGKKLLSEFWEPSMKPDIGLTTWWPSLDTKRDPIAQDSDLMDRLVDIGAISLHQAMSHAVRWNQVSRVTLLLGRGADTNRCRIYASTDMARPHISALDCAYVKCFTKVYQLLVQRNGSTTPDHPTIHEILTTANLGIRSLFAYLESNHSLAASFTFALHIAVLYHQEHLDDAIDVLLACGVSLSADYLSYHAIKPTLANAIPNIDLVGRLLRVGASINHPSVITTASSDSNHFACLRFLVARGINLAKVGSIGLSVALENGNERGFEFLLHAGADVNGKPDPTPELWIPPLSMAAKKGDVKAARTMLYRGANVDIENERRWRPIHYAARFADLRMVKLLVQFGADLGDPKDADVDEWYLSVIESCALRTIPYYSDDPDLLGDLIDRLWSNEDTEIFKYLIEMGAELNSAYVGGSDILRRNPVVANLIRSSAENSVVRFALCMGARFDGRFDPEVTTFATMTPLQAAAKKGNLEMVKELHARGADVNAEPSPYQGATALEAACDGEYDVENRLAVVEYLLDHGADVDADMADGCKRARIVSAAASRGYVEIMIRLLVRGASVKPEILTGQTPLYYAAWDGRLDAVQVLVNTIGSIRYPEQPDYKEEIRIAEKVGHWAIADLLRQARYEPPSESDSE